MGQDLFYFFPVRGRKPLRAADHTRLISNNLFYFFPVRGRKLRQWSWWCQLQQNLFYFFPVRGRKQTCINSRHSTSGDLFYFFPVRGRKLKNIALNIKVKPYIYFISSPSGDGNNLVSSWWIKVLHLIYFISSPSGDGNGTAFSTTGSVVGAFILFLPRQGTETIVDFDLAVKRDFIYFISSPSGDGNIWLSVKTTETS